MVETAEMLLEVVIAGEMSHYAAEYRRYLSKR